MDTSTEWTCIDPFSRRVHDNPAQLLMGVDTVNAVLNMTLSVPNAVIDDATLATLLIRSIQARLETLSLGLYCQPMLNLLSMQQTRVITSDPASEASC